MVTRYKYKVPVEIRDTDRIQEMEDWCIRMFGLSDRGRWYWGYKDDSDYNSDVNYLFEDEKDMLLFRLRWL